MKSQKQLLFLVTKMALQIDPIKRITAPLRSSHASNSLRRPGMTNINGGLTWNTQH